MVTLADDDHVLATTPAGVPLLLEVARSDRKRAQGMMFRTDVPPGTGMLFVLDRPDYHPFWMLNCKVALDILWLDAQGVVVDISPDTPPCTAQPCPNFQPKRPGSLVIELAAGEARRLGLTVGSRVLIDPRSVRKAPR